MQGKITVVIQYKTIKAYAFPSILIASIALGGLAGYLLGPNTRYLKPFGEVFLNLIFTAVVPLIFFSVSSAIARTGSLGKLGRIIFWMMLVFIFTALVAAIYALVIVKCFPPGQGVYLQLAQSTTISPVSFPKQLVAIFSVPDFSGLLSHKNMLALIVFSLLVGLAVATANEKGKKFASFLQAGSEVFMGVFSLIMYYAPLGFFAYFAVLVSELGPKLMESYVRIAVIYYLSTIIYFIVAFSCYAYFAGKVKGIKLFWHNLYLPAATAIATCSSAASIPANLVAAKKMQVPAEIYETVIPLGTMLHKEGSVIGGVFKIAFLFGIFHLDFTGTAVLVTAIGVSILVGTVMGAIPSGGMLGELLILTVYGFPPSVLVTIAAISIIIDPLATTLNVIGNSVSSMMTARLVEGERWLT